MNNRWVGYVMIVPGSEKKRYAGSTDRVYVCVCGNKRYSTRWVRVRMRGTNGYVESNRKIFK